MDTYHVVLYLHLLSLFIGIGAASILMVCLFQLRKAQTLMEAGPWGMMAGKIGRAFPIAVLGLFASVLMAACTAAFVVAPELHESISVAVYGGPIFLFELAMGCWLAVRGLRSSV